MRKLVVTADGKGVPMRRPLEERVRAPEAGRRLQGRDRQSNVETIYYFAAWLRVAT